MAENRLIVRSGSLAELRTETFASGQVPIHPANLIHHYIRLDIDHEVEFAETKEAALRYLRAVAEAASIVHQLVKQPEFGGLVLEAQGSTIHSGIPHNGRYRDTAIAFATAVHYFFEQQLTTHSCVNGWRFTSDVGQTLVIAGRGVHGDHSLVSIGNAANHPAKHLYQQLYIEEEKRRLKRYHLGVRNPDTEQWEYGDLRQASVSKAETRLYDDLKAAIEYDVTLMRSDERGASLVTAAAQPIPPAGSPNAPNASRPAQHHGWVMRADLDGFTAQVETCFDQPDRLNEMALWFADVMDSAASFVEVHVESMVQLPWAGDNFTVAVIFEGKDEYDEARPDRLVNHILDFDDETREGTGENRWAYGVCGGDVHGNAVGNVFIGSVEFENTRFLIGAGAGFARSLQAFADIKPAGGKIEILEQDYQILTDQYKQRFGPVKKVDGSISSLFKEGVVLPLNETRDAIATTDRSIDVQVAPAVTAPLLVKPYAERH